MLFSNTTKIIVDPRSNYSYGSFYLYELRRLFGHSNVLFDIKPFRKLKDIGNDMRFIAISDSNIQTKYFIHTNDPYHISKEDYEWCDIYGCVNANYTHYPKEQYPKLKSLVPSFGIRIEESLLKVLLESCKLLLSVWPYVISRTEWNKVTKQAQCNKWRNLKHYFSRRYKTWKNRLPYTCYNNELKSEDNYIFFLSTLWYNNEWNCNDEGVNKRRANFIRACKSIPNIEFEGGLLADNSSSKSLFADVLAINGEPFPQWIEKTKRSSIVFNTPAFWDCHGWKLGEYLAMGKCIISTQLSNDLPYPLEHGKNIHFVENSEQAMKDAIEYIIAHPDYKHSLEQGAREYWSQYGTPEASLKLLGIIQ